MKKMIMTESGKEEIPGTIRYFEIFGEIFMVHRERINKKWQKKGWSVSHAATGTKISCSFLGCLPPLTIKEAIKGATLELSMKGINETKQVISKQEVINEV